ncbi:MAG: efflux RND transporter periplasmic adaptor subunit [Opitutaceae bacterium]
MTKFQRILNFNLFFIVVFLAFLVVKGMIANKPERETRTPPPVVPSVRFIDSSPTDFTPIIQSYGNVRSYYQAELSAQVSGKIISIDPNFNSGQTVEKGDLLVEIDPSDYLANVAQAEANLASAEQALSEEMTRANLAAQDWVESGRKLEDATDLTLRKPQLGAAKASVASAQASLYKANLDLNYTKIRAPFDAIVQSRDTSPGNYLNTGASLGSLVSKELAEVRLPLTPQQVSRLKLPNSGAPSQLEATLTSPTQPGAKWQATITRTEPSVDQQNQVIYVVGEIEKPFADKQAFLPIGAFVDARIAADPVEDAHLIPNTALVEDAFVWVISDENTLVKAAVTRVVAKGDSIAVRFNDSNNDGSYKVATRPLASFSEGQSVKPMPMAK